MGKITYTIDTTLAKDMTIGEVFEMANKIDRARGVRNTDIDKDLGIAVVYLRNELLAYRFNETGYKHKVRDFYLMRKVADEDFIQNHRLNYVTYYVVQDIADWLDEKKRLRFTAKHFWSKSEEVFKSYQHKHRSMVDRSTWMTIQDHMRLVWDVVTPHIEPLEFAVRDYLIQKRSSIQQCGQIDDITLLSKAYVALMFCAALRNTRNNFFKTIYDAKGFDLSCLFAYSDIGNVCLNFTRMLQSMGVKFDKDADGDDVPTGVDVSKSVRVESEWNNIVYILTDKDLMDEQALQAINMNPKTKAEYESIIAAEDKREMKDAIEQLKLHHNVSKL